MSATQTLLREIEAFLANAEMADSTFGRKAVNDGKLLARLRSGRSVSLDTAEKVRTFIVEQGTPARGAAE